MNATAEKLDHFLSEADPETARAVEQIVSGLLSLRVIHPTVKHQSPPVLGSHPTSALPVHAMGKVLAGIDPHQLGQLPDDF